MTLPPSFKAKVLAASAQQPSMTRRDEYRRRAVLLGGTMLVIGAGSFMRGVPHPTAHRPWSYIAITAGVAALAAGFASWWMLTSGGSALGRPRPMHRLIALATPLVLAAGAIWANLHVPESWTPPSPDPMLHAMCLAAYLMLGSLALAFSVSALRPVDPVAPRLTGAALGAATSAWVSFAMALQCPYPDPVHVLATHVTPAVLFIVAGAWLGQRRFGVRYSQRPPTV